MLPDAATTCSTHLKLHLCTVLSARFLATHSFFRDSLAILYQVLLRHVGRLTGHPQGCGRKPEGISKITRGAGKKFEEQRGSGGNSPFRDAPSPLWCFLRTQIAVRTKLSKQSAQTVGLPKTSVCWSLPKHGSGCTAQQARDFGCVSPPQS